MSIEAQARDLLADTIAAKGRGWTNTAHSVRAGYSNVWIEASIKAIIIALQLPRYDEED